MRNAPSSAWDDVQRETFQTFYQAQNQRLFQYAILLTGDRHQAEEAVQTAWCQCLTYRETFFRVPEDKRLALELKFVLEWQEEKIAEQLGLSLGATYTRISRGRRLLQERLIREGYADGYQRKGQKR